MKTLWKYAENTFDSVTVSNFKLMNVLLKDHAARCATISSADPLNQLLLDAVADAQAALAAWTLDYTKWNTCRGQYKGRTQFFYERLEELAGLKIRQWDAAVQGVFLEGTPDYTAIFPNGRGPFQKGSLDQRVAAVTTLSSALAAYPALAALKGQVDAYLVVLNNARFAQQSKETEVDTCSAAVELGRQAAAKQLYRNLARMMLVFWETPVKVEDAFDMNYIRDGATPPPEDEPEPEPPTPPAPQP